MCIYFMHITDYSIYYMLIPTYNSNIHCTVCIYFMRIMFYSIYYMLKFNIQIQYSKWQCCIYFMRIMFYAIFYRLNPTFNSNIHRIVLHIFHAHYVLWHILHVRFNIKIQYSLLRCGIYFMRIMLSCLSRIMAYITWLI